MNLSSCLKLYIVLETDMLKLPLDEFLKEVLSAGAGIVQLRNKYQPYEEKIKTAQIVRKITSDYNALFIMNDSLELALKLGADGLHLSYKDGHIKEIRQNNKGLILGYSCNNEDDVLLANDYADYAGIGPYTDTSTKKDHRAVLGAKGIYSLNSMLKIPAVAIGGINSMNAKDVLSSQVTGLAVSSYLCASKKPYDDALKLMEIINERV